MVPYREWEHILSVSKWVSKWLCVCVCTVPVAVLSHCRFQSLFMSLFVSLASAHCSYTFQCTTVVAVCSEVNFIMGTEYAISSLIFLYIIRNILWQCIFTATHPFLGIRTAPSHSLSSSVALASDWCITKDISLFVYTRPNMLMDCCMGEKGRFGCVFHCVCSPIPFVGFDSFVRFNLNRILMIL